MNKIFSASATFAKVEVVMQPSKVKTIVLNNFFIIKITCAYDTTSKNFCHKFVCVEYNFAGKIFIWWKFWQDEKNLERRRKISMTVADLKVEGIANYQRIVNIEIFEEMHKHGICKLTFVMKDDFKASEVVNWAQKKITVKGKVKNSDKFVFCGFATQYGVENHAGTIFLLVTVETLSCKLEVSKKVSATFQKASKKFSDLLNEVKKNYQDADFSVAENEANKTIPELIYRKNLTDWEFVKELAESHGQILFCDSKSDRLKVSLGFKAFKEFDGKEFKILRQNLPLEFGKRLEKNTYEGARPTYFLETEFFTYDVEIGVGHGVKYDNQTQAVIASHLYLRDNILCNEIKIRHKEGCRADAFTVTDYFDRFYYLTGTVLEVTGKKKTDLKIQFDCDENQDKNDALEIPYESVVSNYLYTMPDEKDKVFVYVDNHFSIFSIRQTACAARPSRRPIQPIFSFVVAFTPTSSGVSPSVFASVFFISARCGESFGVSAIKEESILTSL